MTQDKHLVQKGTERAKAMREADRRLRERIQQERERLAHTYQPFRGLKLPV